MKQTKREQLQRTKEVKAMWQMPTQEETVEYVKRKLGRTISRAGVSDAERRPIVKIKRELMKWMQERRAA